MNLCRLIKGEWFLFWASATPHTDAHTTLIVAGDGNMIKMSLKRGGGKGGEIEEYIAFFLV